MAAPLVWEDIDAFDVLGRRVASLRRVITNHREECVWINQAF